MMRYIKLLLLVICVPIFVSASHNTNSAASSSYDIANIYEKVEPYREKMDAAGVMVPNH